MAKTRIAKSVNDAAWTLLKKIIVAKVDETGGSVEQVDMFFPSSQLCSDCGFKNKNAKDLNVRDWVCSNCNSEHDRDENAAQNILQEGMAGRATPLTKSKYTRGGNVRPAHGGLNPAKRESTEAKKLAIGISSL